jgi:hypothetical protein
MVTLTKGRVLSEPAYFGGVKWLKMVLTRAPNLVEARMRTMKMKRMRLV